MRQGRQEGSGADPIARKHNQMRTARVRLCTIQMKKSISAQGQSMVKSNFRTKSSRKLDKIGESAPKLFYARQYNQY